MSSRFQTYVDSLDELTKQFYQETLDSWSNEKLLQATKMAHVLDRAGCNEPESWIFSELQEDIPQTATFSFLNNLWKKSIEPAPVIGLQNLGLTDDKCKKSLEIIDKALTEEEKVHLFKSFAVQLGWDFVNALDDGCNEEYDEILPGWALMEVDVNDELTNRHLGGLHESFMDEEFSGESF